LTVHMTRLENGLTILTNEMPHLKSAAVGVWVGAGSRSEREDQHGISHLLEHMAFKGTSRRSALDIAAEIEAVGGEVNAATGIENTSYYARILAEDLPLAVDILGDILTNSSFDEEELAREQNVILQEIGAAYDIPEDRVFDYIQEIAFPDQPLGRTILGTAQTVRSFSADAIRAYMASQYHGHAMILSAAGGISHDELVALGKKAFASLPDGVADAPQAARYCGGEIHDLQADLKEAQLILGFRGRSYKAQDFYATQTLASILGGGMSSRLFQEVREKRGLCYSVYAFHWGFADSGLFGIHAATDADNIKGLMPVILDELLRACDDIGQSELDRARAQIKAGLLMGMESPASRASQLARQKLLFGHPLTMDEMVEKIEAVDLDQIRMLISDILTGSTPSLASVGPVKGMMGLDAVSRHLS
jgi:predicted Zn-dependent peptidase